MIGGSGRYETLRTQRKEGGVDEGYVIYGWMINYFVIEHFTLIPPKYDALLVVSKRSPMY